MNPIDYSIDVQSPFQSALQGYAGGAAIRNDMQAQQAARLKQEQAAAQQAQQQRVISSLITNPSAGAQDYAAASLLVPGLKDQFKQAWEMKNIDQQQSQLRDMGQVYAAVSSGRPDIASQRLNARADALEASGAAPREIQALRAQAKVVEAHPEFARASVGMMLSALPGGDKFITGASGLGAEQRATAEAPADLAIKNATAGIKGVEAANAPVKTALDNANTQSTIDDRAAGQRIAELNVQIGQANSETTRGQLILERDKLQQTQDAKKLEATGGAQDGVDTIQRSLATVDQVMKAPGIEGFFTGAGTLGGKMSALIPGSERKDLQGLVDTLKAQNFMTGIQQMKGMGALSNSEGDKISSAVASLDLDQSPKAFKTALGVVRSTLEKAQAKAVASGKLPTTGGAFLMKIPGVGNVTDGDVNRLMAAQPGATREQVIQYLNSRAGKGAGGAQGSY